MLLSGEKAIAPTHSVSASSVVVTSLVSTSQILLSFHPRQRGVFHSEQTLLRKSSLYVEVLWSRSGHQHSIISHSDIQRSQANFRLERNATEVTMDAAPPLKGMCVSVAISSFSATFHNLKVLSSLPLANIFPSGENATLLTLSVCPLKVTTVSSTKFHSLTLLSSLPLATRELSTGEKFYRSDRTEMLKNSDILCKSERNKRQ